MKTFEASDGWTYRVLGGIPYNRDVMVVNLIRHRPVGEPVWSKTLNREICDHEQQVFNNNEWVAFKGFDRIKPTLEMPGLVWRGFVDALPHLQDPVDMSVLDPEVLLALLKAVTPLPTE